MKILHRKIVFMVKTNQLWLFGGEKTLTVVSSVVQLTINLDLVPESFCVGIIHNTLHLPLLLREDLHIIICTTTRRGLSGKCFSGDNSL